MKALVTGGAGFIGSHIAEYLINKGHQIVVLDDLSGGYLRNVPKQCLFVQGSITNYKLLKELFAKEKFDYVFHLAAYAAESLSHFIRRFNYTQNLIGSVNLINLSILHNIKCFIFTSSIAVYGDLDTILEEGVSLHPIDPYGIAKFAVEMDLRAAFHNFGLNSIIFRPHNVYGERQNISDKYRNVIGIFINQMLSGNPMTIFGDGLQTRAFTYIRDIVPIVAESIFVPQAFNQAFNVGSDEVITINHISDIVSEKMGLPSSKIFLTERKETKQTNPKHERIKQYFEAGSKTSIHTGIQNMLDWINQENCLVEKPKTKRVEIPFGLPDGW